MRSKRFVKYALLGMALFIPLTAETCAHVDYQGGQDGPVGGPVASDAANQNGLCHGNFHVEYDGGGQFRVFMVGICNPARDVFTTCDAKLFRSYGQVAQDRTHGDQGCTAIAVGGSDSNWGARGEVYFRLNNPTRNWKQGLPNDTPHLRWCTINNNNNGQSVLHCLFSAGKVILPSPNFRARSGAAQRLTVARAARRLGIVTPTACAALSDRSWREVKPDSSCARAAMEVWRRLPEAKKQVLLGGR